MRPSFFSIYKCYFPFKKKKKSLQSHSHTQTWKQKQVCQRNRAWDSHSNEGSSLNFQLHVSYWDHSDQGSLLSCYSASRTHLWVWALGSRSGSLVVSFLAAWSLDPYPQLSRSCCELPNTTLIFYFLLKLIRIGFYCLHLRTLTDTVILGKLPNFFCFFIYKNEDTDIYLIGLQENKIYAINIYCIYTVYF